MPSSTALVVLAGCLLAGCYQRHAPWERAAPDGSAIWMRVDLSSGGRYSTHGFLEVRFDGTYAASPINELRVCTGTLSPSELGAWAELIERTGAFGREGPQGTALLTHADGTGVRIASEDGLATSFRFSGGGWDPALEGFRRGAEELWATLDLETCAPAALDPATTSVHGWIDRFDPRDEARRTARLEIERDGAVRAGFGLWSIDDDALEPCAPLADSERLWAAVLAASPFTVRRPDGWGREVSVSVRSEVRADDGTLHERRVYGKIQSSRPEQAALEEALVSLIETHCGP